METVFLGVRITGSHRKSGNRGSGNFRGQLTKYLDGAAIFPAAGHMSLAIEALNQVFDAEAAFIDSVTLRDVRIQTALVIDAIGNLLSY
ncbi:hypothetical protein EYZ11_008621 [Aspergillus tanneri]|uniref:Polyketide synthase dehydratase domain-containing protein n=1 Tax=Aspergillus tanneri TaxID=1220188 RepID=A0A4S3JFG4_9EURO|nr:hypothetical protein EYZ11_008621 [Aspergillus tanneri]